MITIELLGVEKTIHYSLFELLYSNAIFHQVKDVNRIKKLHSQFNCIASSTKREHSPNHVYYSIQFILLEYLLRSSCALWLLLCSSMQIFHAMEYWEWHYFIYHFNGDEIHICYNSRDYESIREPTTMLIKIKRHYE